MRLSDGLNRIPWAETAQHFGYGSAPSATGPQKRDFLLERVK